MDLQLKSTFHNPIANGTQFWSISKPCCFVVDIQLGKSVNPVIDALFRVDPSNVRNLKGRGPSEASLSFVQADKVSLSSAYVVDQMRVGRKTRISIKTVTSVE